MFILNSPRNGAHLIACKRSWHFPGKPKLVWHPAHRIKEWGCIDMSMDTQHLKYPLVLFGSEGSALTLARFLLSPGISMLVIVLQQRQRTTFWSYYRALNGLCVSMCRLSTYSFIHSYLIQSGKWPLKF